MKFFRKFYMGIGGALSSMLISKAKLAIASFGLLAMTSCAQFQPLPDWAKPKPRSIIPAIAQCETPTPNISTPKIAEHAQYGVLPIIDAHMHLNKDMSAEGLIIPMDNAGVKQMVLQARYYGPEAGGGGSDEQALLIASKYPGRFLPFIAGQRPELGGWRTDAWEMSDTGYAEEAREKARSGNFYGMGEYIMFHHAYYFQRIGQTGGSFDVDMPVYSTLMFEIAKIGANHNLPVLIHFEGEPDHLGDMIRFLKTTRDTKIIWAHSCGRMSARQIRGFLTRFPNLYCDLTGMVRIGPNMYGNYWPRRTPWIHPIEDGAGILCPEMKSLYEEFPKRFVIGTDTAHTPALRIYEEKIERFRVLFSQLTPATARRLAYQNAKGLFGLK